MHNCVHHLCTCTCKCNSFEDSNWISWLGCLKQIYIIVLITCSFGSVSFINMFRMITLIIFSILWKSILNLLIYYRLTLYILFLSIWILKRTYLLYKMSPSSQDHNSSKSHSGCGRCCVYSWSGNAVYSRYHTHQTFYSLPIHWKQCNRLSQIQK